MKLNDLKKNDGTIAIPFFGGLGYPLKKIRNNGKDFLYLTALVSFLNAAAALLSVAFVSPSFSIYSQLINVFLGGYYINRWFAVSETEEKMSLRINLRDIKTALWFLVYLGLWGVFGFSSYILSVRNPSADWREELLFFAAVSLVVIVVLLMIMNFVCLIRFLKKERWFCLKKTFWPVMDNLYKLFGWFFAYLILFTYALYFVAKLSKMPLFLPVELFLFYFIFYAAVAVFVSSLSYQDKFIFGDKS